MPNADAYRAKLRAKFVQSAATPPAGSESAETAMRGIA